MEFPLSLGRRMLGMRAQRWTGPFRTLGAGALLFGVGLAAAAGLTPGSRAAGSVAGTLRLNPPRASSPPPLSPYARPRYRPPARADAADPSIRSAVIYLAGANVPPPASTATVQVLQRNRTILPHLTVVRVGTRVEFPNEDDVFHNIFSLSGPHRFNLGRYPPGGSKSEVFTKPGVVRLFCDIHSEMGGIILVLDTPYFVRPDADGRFRLDGVPPGEYTAVAWHESVGADSTRVVVTDGGETEVDFALGF